jgi:EAL and modified HD-GYP domain-containing signal transduction protein
MVGRQPIFDSGLDVFGYELLYRSQGTPAPSGETMTAEVLVHAGLDLGLEGLVGTKLAFLNTPYSFLVGEYTVPISPAQVVIEVPGDVPRDEEVLEGCRKLVANGYMLALDDPVLGRDPDPLLGLASIAKLDILSLGPDELAAAADTCSASDVRLVAKKVETRQQLGVCQELGFDLFQGYLLSRPEVTEGRALAPNQLTCVRLLRKLSDPDTSATEIEQIVQTDPALSYRFLRAAGAGAGGGFFRQLRSVRDAVVLLGERRIRSWVSLMLLTDAREGEDEQLNIALTRARMTELMVQKLAPCLVDSAFTVGLVSALDLLLKQPLSMVLKEFALSRELEEALLLRTGLLGTVLTDVLAWEVGGGDLRPGSGFSPAEMAANYLQALKWANETSGVLDLAGKP